MEKRERIERQINQAILAVSDVFAERDWIEDDRFLFTQKKILHGGCLRFPILVSFSWFHLIHWIIYTYRSFAGRHVVSIRICFGR